MEKDNLAYLRLIFDAIGKIGDYILGISEGDFYLDQKTQSAVIMQLEVIGELSKKVPQEIKSDINLPWGKIAGLRNVISHEYFRIDIKSIWKTIHEHIPEMKEEIEKYLLSR